MKAIQKTLPRYYSPPPIKFSSVCFSTAYERAEGSNAAEEGKEGKNGSENRAAEMAEKVKESAKKTMNGAWRAARDTTTAIKEATVGEAGDQNDGPNKDIDHPDPAVQDLRKRAQGYDLADH